MYRLRRSVGRSEQKLTRRKAFAGVASGRDRDTRFRGTGGDRRSGNARRPRRHVAAGKGSAASCLSRRVLGRARVRWALGYRCSQGCLASGVAAGCITVVSRAWLRFARCSNCGRGAKVAPEDPPGRHKALSAALSAMTGHGGASAQRTYLDGRRDSDDVYRLTRPGAEPIRASRVADSFPRKTAGQRHH